MMRARFKQIATALEIRPALVGTLSTLLLLIIWSIWASEAEGMHSSFVGPLELLRRLYLLATQGYGGTSLWVHIGASLFRTGAGFIAGAIVGICVGMAMGYSSIISSALAPFFSFIRPIPPIAYIPLVILWFGIGEESKLFLTSLGVLGQTPAAPGRVEVREEPLAAPPMMPASDRTLASSAMTHMVSSST